MQYFDYAIDWALEKRDFEWAKDLVKQKDEYLMSLEAKNKNEISELPKLNALENLNDVYVVKEEHGLRNIIMSSEDDILKSHIVEIKNYNYKNGVYANQDTLVEYQEYDIGGETVIKYYLLGQSRGIQFGYKLRKNNIGILNKLDDTVQNYIKKYGLKD